MILCVRGTCQNEAEVLPVLKLWAANYRRDTHPPARVQFGLPCCRRCSLDVKVEDLVDTAGARDIARDFVKQRRMVPSFKTAQIEWILLTSKEAREFIGSIPAPVKGTIH